jgi:hypothetical protein
MRQGLWRHFLGEKAVQFNPSWLPSSCKQYFRSRHKKTLQFCYKYQWC